MAFVVRVFDRNLKSARDPARCETQMRDLARFKGLDPSRMRVLSEHTQLYGHTDYAFPPGGSLTIGRFELKSPPYPAVFLPLDDAVSRFHGTFSVRNGIISYNDDSANGTWLNGTWFRHRTAVLEVGAMLEVGTRICQVSRIMLMPLETKSSYSRTGLGYPLLSIPDF